MIEYKYGDKVNHPRYGVCVFGAYSDDERTHAVIWNGKLDGEHVVSASALTPADSRIIKIDGVYHRVYTSLDAEEARELIGKRVFFAGDPACLGGDCYEYLDSITQSGGYLCAGDACVYGYIAVPIETPELSERPVTIPEFCRFIETHTDWYEHTLDQIKKEREGKR